jgi:tripartite-type tricarboxylate transporter receptor subunit TctC
MRAPMTITRRGFGGLAAGLLATSALGAAPADSWPDRPVKMVVPFGAGGAVDTLARLFAERFADFANGQTLVVENRSGAGGMVAGSYTNAQPADGYTLMMADIGANVVGKELNPKLSYEPLTGFTPIMQGAILHAVMIAHPSVEEKTLAEVIASARAKPEGFVYSSAGVGNISHLAMALLEQQTGVKMVHVPYRSGSEAVTAVMRGDAQFSFPSLSSAFPMIKGGQVRPVAMGGDTTELLPGVPSARDTIPGFEAAVWYGVVAPPGMDLALADRINAVFNQVAAVPEVRKAVAETQAGRVIGGTRADFGSFLQSEYDRWSKVIRAGGIRTE